jgi:hypothetical protein
MADDGDPQMKASIDAIDAVKNLAPGEGARALLAAWLMVADRARNEALAFPDGFAEERSLQVDQLRSLADFIEDEEPDLERARGLHEGEWARQLRLLRKLYGGK